MTDPESSGNFRAEAISEINHMIGYLHGDWTSEDQKALVLAAIKKLQEAEKLLQMSLISVR